MHQWICIDYVDKLTIDIITIHTFPIFITPQNANIAMDNDLFIDDLHMNKCDFP